MAISMEELLRAFGRPMAPVQNVQDMPVGQMPQQAPQRPAQAAQAQPATPDRPRGLLGFLGDPDARARLAIALEGMTMNPNQALIGEMQRGIETRATTAQKNATAEWLKSRGRDDLAEAMLQGGLPPADALRLAMEPPKGPDLTSGMQEYQLAVQQGYQGSFLDYKRDLALAGKPETTINMGAEPGRYIYGTDAGVPNGWRVDTMTGRAEVIPGGPADVEATTTTAKKEERVRQSEIKMGTTLESINLNVNAIEQGALPMTGPIGTLLQNIPGTPQRDFANRTMQINTRAALDEVQNMRDNSPTGGAVGQLTDSEREAIGLAATSLNNSSSEQEYLRAAKRFREVMLDTAYGKGNWELDATGQVTAKMASDIPAGVTPELWEVMTPEERALWQ